MENFDARVGNDNMECGKQSSVVMSEPELDSKLESSEHKTYTMVIHSG